MTTITKDKVPSTVYVNFNDFIEGKSKTTDFSNHQFRDVEGMMYLKNELGLKYFSQGPVGLLFGKTYECMTAAYFSLDEIFGMLYTHIENGREVILYDLIYTPALPQYHEIDPKTFAPVPLEKPTMANSGWKVRYGVV